ncbi:MAG: lytic transglycosylase domain-containing protein [Acidimicrobiia bacterium]|nr:lytic transglycosylase domain-containing protein [Acidimicrobiia bacterium]
MVDAVDETLRARLAAAEADVVDASQKVETARTELGRIVAEVHETTRRRDAAEAILIDAEPAMPAAQERYRDTFMVATVSGSDMSVVAFDAYRTAASSQASCRIHWTVLAGIGRVESRHGTYGGARPQSDGTTSPRIIGITLDGRPGIATITDTDGGAFDGDRVYDRAVGPMQFIPGTWRTARRDGNGDGRQDPHSLYDAAAAAAAYLCRFGGGLDHGGRLNQAILSYNQSQHYVNEVLRYGRSYAHLE